MYNQYWGPERARLNNQNEGSYGSCWLTKYNDIGQWIQVDFAKITKVTRIATQGRFDANQWLKTYSLSYSPDGSRFVPYDNGRVCIKQIVCY